MTSIGLARPVQPYLTAEATRKNRHRVAREKRMKKIIAYYRVSTKKQKASGLGLEAQKQAVADFAKQNGFKIDMEYQEQESGGDNSRPELRKAILRAKATGYKLVVAKLDRLSRSVAFTAALMESKVDFVCCDNPHANSLTIHILAAMAEHERKAAKERTKAALKAKKGLKTNLTKAARLLGTKKGQPMATEAAAAMKNQRRNEHYAGLLKDIVKMGQKMSYAEIADELNRRNEVTVKGKPFTTMAIYRLFKKLPAAPFAF
jgi:DNA invertase Pin-like site-specific DNA recombinase